MQEHVNVSFINASTDIWRVSRY